MNARALSLALVLMFMATIASAQSRKIGHRSHSGSPATFAMMLVDDHLGNPPNTRYNPQMRLPVYRVDPFIARVRKHYEEVAKQPTPVETPASEPTKQEKAADPAPSEIETQQPPTPASAPKPKATKASIPKLAVIPPPDFLVKARPSAPEPMASNSDKNPESSFWMLILLLGIPVAPVVFVASAWHGRKQPVG